MKVKLSELSECVNDSDGVFGLLIYLKHIYKYPTYKPYIQHIQFLTKTLVLQALLDKVGYIIMYICRQLGAYIL